MPKDINEVHIAGHAGKDAETKYTPSGKQVSKFSLATGGGKKKDGGNWPTEWHNVESWSESASEVRKGDFVEVWGRLKTDSWDDRQTGQKKYMTKVVATKLEIEGDRPTRREEPGSFESGFETSRSAPIAKGDYAITDEHLITDDDIPF